MILYLLAGPAAVGKTTITEWIAGERGLDLPVIITCTSRPKRPTELDGVHFHFKQPGELEAMNEHGELFEYAVNHGNAYGTPWSFLPTDGHDAMVIFDIGAAVSAREKLQRTTWDSYSPSAGGSSGAMRGVVIFLDPMGGAADLIPRLKARGSPQEEIERRMETAAHEVKRKGEADYVIPCWNNGLACVYQDVLAIVRAERLRT